MLPAYDSVGRRLPAFRAALKQKLLPLSDWRRWGRTKERTKKTTQLRGKECVSSGLIGGYGCRDLSSPPLLHYNLGGDRLIP